MKTNSVSSCLQCGGRLFYKPSTTLIVCKQCLSEFAFQINNPNVTFFDYNTHKSSSKFVFENINTLNYNSCGAEIYLFEEINNTCSFYRSSLKNEKIIEKQKKQALGIFPFQISQKNAVENYILWIKKNRFTSNNFSKFKYTNKENQYSLIILPILINIHKYKNKLYKLVNRTTNHFVGDRPYNKAYNWLDTFYTYNLSISTCTRNLLILFLYFGLTILTYI